MDLRTVVMAGVLAASAGVVQAQQTVTPQAAPAPVEQKSNPSAAGEYGRGAGDVGAGAGKGVGKAAEGAGKGAGDVATLHPVKGAEAVGKGGAVGAKDVGVGAAKGTGKVLKGTGKVLTHPF